MKKIISFESTIRDSASFVSGTSAGNRIRITLTKTQDLTVREINDLLKVCHQLVQQFLKGRKHDKSK